jgi:hypothetical protein
VRGKGSSLPSSSWYEYEDVSVRRGLRIDGIDIIHVNACLVSPSLTPDQVGRGEGELLPKAAPCRDARSTLRVKSLLRPRMAP